jgi:hypothetical protein
MRHLGARKMNLKGHGTVVLKRAVLATAVSIAGVSTVADAGEIVSVPAANGAAGFNGWNLGNVKVVLNGTQGEIDSDSGSWFNEVTGAYEFATDSDHTYRGDVYDNYDDVGIAMGQVLAKDYPVGEPSGIKVINRDPGVKNGKPENCIMATSYLDGHYLGSIDPKQVTCSSPFQTHKRYKLAMLPSTVPAGSELDESENPVDLVFNVIDGEASDYQVFQKINNWTDTRLQGFTIQVGFGLGINFQTVEEAENVGLENLHLSVPTDIWSSTQLATFSAGLFGPEDKHTGKRGFFDQFTRAGFQIDEYGVEGLTDSLHATKTLGSDYANVPDGAGLAANQFGPWLPNNMLPYGIFFDDDGNPATDAELVAWYGYNPNLDVPGIGWMRGAGDNFSEIGNDQINEWGENLLYTMGEIDDLVNVGLNYIVTIGDITNFPSDTFTIRITPTADESGASFPVYMNAPGDAQTPDPALTFTNPVSIVEISPSPEFVVGELLTARVGDANLSEENAFVSISTSSDLCALPTENLPLLEQGEGRKVFAAALPEMYSNMGVGCSVTVTYSDTDPTAQVAATTTAIDAPVLPPIVADASITDLSVPVSLFDGQTRNLKVSIINDKASEALATGTVLLTGTDGSEYTAAFTDLRLGGKLKFSFSWTAALVDPEIAQAIEWTATLRVEDEVGETQIVDDASALTQVDVKKGKNSKK